MLNFKKLLELRAKTKAQQERKAKFQAALPDILEFHGAKENTKTWEQHFFCPKCNTKSIFYPLSSSWTNPCNCMRLK